MYMYICMYVYTYHIYIYSYIHIYNAYVGNCIHVCLFVRREEEEEAMW